jgi:hypothetical protein
MKAPGGIDLTGSFCTKRFERNCFGKDPGYAEETF